MAFTATKRGEITTLGHYRVGFFHLDEVTNAGSSVDLRPFGFGALYYVGATNQEDVNNPQVAINSVTDSTTEDDPGQFFIQLPATTGPDDILIMAVGKVG